MCGRSPAVYKQLNCTLCLRCNLIWSSATTFHFYVTYSWNQLYVRLNLIVGVVTELPAATNLIMILVCVPYLLLLCPLIPPPSALANCSSPPLSLVPHAPPLPLPLLSPLLSSLSLPSSPLSSPPLPSPPLPSPPLLSPPPDCRLLWTTPSL